LLIVPVPPECAILNWRLLVREVLMSTARPLPVLNRVQMNAQRAESRRRTGIGPLAIGALDDRGPRSRLRLGVAVGTPPGAPPPANGPPQAEIVTPADGAIYLGDNTVAYTGRGTAAADRHCARIVRRFQ
jgi:hypothetical protein